MPHPRGILRQPKLETVGMSKACSDPLGWVQCQSMPAVARGTPCGMAVEGEATLGDNAQRGGGPHGQMGLEVRDLPPRTEEVALEDGCVDDDMQTGSVLETQWVSASKYSRYRHHR